MASTIFRAYDIRGVFGQDLTPEIALDVGKAYGTFIGGKGKVSVGRDNRMSSPELGDSIIKGILSAGVDVVDVGTVPTPLLYFSIHYFRLDGGVMVTGSHNPPDYNGFKLCRGTSTLYGPEIQELKKIIDGKKFLAGKGKLNRENVIEKYIKDVKSRIHVDRKIKVVVDAGNGTSGLIAPRLLRELGCEVVELYCTLDGRFPNHHPDPTVDEYLKDLISAVKREKADFGVAYDGDADRAGFIDNSGGIVRGDQALILFSREILAENKGAKIIFEVKCSQALSDDIKAHGGMPLMYRTGHSFIKNKMREENAPLAGEMSGHFYFGGSEYYGFDDGIYASVRMAQILSETSGKMSEMIAGFPKYYSTPEIRLDCPDESKFHVVEEVTKKFQDSGFEVITVDGARIQFDGGWGLVRASNTQPALILRFEAKTPEKLEEIKTTILAELKKHPQVKRNTL